jgi:hypothetical protein
MPPNTRLARMMLMRKASAAYNAKIPSFAASIVPGTVPGNPPGRIASPNAYAIKAPMPPVTRVRTK